MSPLNSRTLTKIFVFICALFASTACQNVAREKSHKTFNFENGVLDLRNWDPAKDGPASLTKKWEFYWMRLLSPADFKNTKIRITPDALLETPARWNGQKIGGHTLSGQGYATYRLKIRLSESAARMPLAVRYEEQANASALYWNGVKVVDIGHVATNKQEAKNEWALARARIDATPENEIILQISNFSHRYGGFFAPVQLGSAEQIFADRESARLIEMFLSGAILIVGLYHLGLFWARRSERSVLWFGLFCLCITLRLLTTGERQLHELLPLLSWSTLVKIEYLTVFAALPLWGLFIQSLFPKEFNLWICKGVIAFNLILACVVIFFPPLIFSYTIDYFLIEALLFILYTLIALAFAALRHRPGALLILIGSVIPFATVVNDVIFIRYSAGPGLLLPLGLFLFIFAQSTALARLFAKSFKQVEQLLDESNSLREKLLQKEKLAAIGNMAAGIVHDFKNPVHIIRSAAEFAEDATLDEESRTKYLRVISDESLRLGEMAQDILDFTRGNVTIEKEDILLAEFLETVEYTLDPYFTKKHIGFEIANKTEGKVHLDKDRMLRVFINIGANAADVLHKDNCFKLEITRSNEGLLFAFCDDGPGVPEKIIPTLFEPFVTEGKATGTGLGMAVSKSIVEAHGGRIWFTTAAGEGTTFFVEIPV